MQEIRLISVIVTMKNVEQSIMDLTKKLVSTMANLHYPYEILFVDQNSMDTSLNIASSLTELATMFKVFRSGDFEDGCCDWNGLANIANGELVVTIDANSKQHPMFIPELIRYIENGGQINSGSKYVPAIWLKEYIKTCDKQPQRRVEVL